MSLIADLSQLDLLIVLQFCSLDTVASLLFIHDWTSGLLQGDITECMACLGLKELALSNSCYMSFVHDTVETLIYYYTN